MKKKILGIFVMTLLIATAILPGVASTNSSKNIMMRTNTLQQSPLSYNIEVWQNNVLLGAVESYTGNVNGKLNYNYFSASAHPANGPTPSPWVSKLYFYGGSDGLSMGMFHNVDYGDALFCTVTKTVKWSITAPPSTVVLESDDAGELTATSGTCTGLWSYYTFGLLRQSNTDGGVIGTFNCGDEITIEPSDWGNIIKWNIYSNDGSFINLDMGQPVRLIIKCIGTCAWSGNTADTKAIIGPISITIAGINDLILEFLKKYSLLSGSYVTLEISTDGCSSWTVINEFSGDYSCYLNMFDLTPYIGEVIYLKFEYRHGTGQVGEGFFINNIKLYDPTSAFPPFYEEDFNSYAIGDDWDPSGISGSPWEIVGLELDITDPDNNLYICGGNTGISLCMPVMIMGIVATIHPIDPCCCDITEVNFYVDNVLKGTDQSAPYSWSSGPDCTQVFPQFKTIKFEVVTDNICCGTIVRAKTVLCWLC